MTKISYTEDLTVPRSPICGRMGQRCKWPFRCGESVCDVVGNIEGCGCGVIAMLMQVIAV